MPPAEVIEGKAALAEASAAKTVWEDYIAMETIRKKK